MVPQQNPEDSHHGHYAAIQELSNPRPLLRSISGHSLACGAGRYLRIYGGRLEPNWMVGRNWLHLETPTVETERQIRLEFDTRDNRNLVDRFAKLHERAAHTSRWRAAQAELASFRGREHSAFDMHVRGFLAAVVVRDMERSTHWVCWCQCHSSSPAEAPLSLVLDYLHASDHLKRKKDSKPSRTRMMTHIKALRRIALKLDLPVLAALQSQTVADFLKSQTRIPFERSEASPIPLAVLEAWEQRVISNQSSLPENISLGCFLIATMASLRFRDLLRTKPDSLSTQGHILRGISLRTKTSVSGQPWGVCCLGITTRPSDKHWVFPFLEAIQIGLTKSREYWGENWSPDFLFPSWADSIPFSSPCSYHHALALIRFYTQCNWIQPPLLSAEEAKHLSTRSMKSTMLAAAGQLNMNLEQHATQGHHKKSVQLYSRDDVWPSLFLQRDILVDISTGWRPLTSQSRGAKQPLPEPPFFTPPITQADLQLIQMLPPKRDSKQSPTTSDISSDPPPVLSGSDSDESSTSSSSNSTEDQPEELDAAVLALNEKTRVTNPDSSKRSCFKIKGTNYEVVCGSSVLNAPVKFVPEIPVGAKVCQRKACVSAIDRFIH